MGTATALGLQIARRVRDASQREITAAGYLDFINQAIEDLIGAGWLQPQSEDTSLTLADGDFDYTIPSGFAYIRRLVVEDSNGDYPLENEIPKGQWYITAGALIYFYPDIADMIIDGRKLKIIGQKRPTGDLAGTATIVAGMLSFIRERATGYAWEFLAGGVSELGQTRLRLAEAQWQKSERLLAQHPMEFRVRVDSVYVEGR